MAQLTFSMKNGCCLPLSTLKKRVSLLLLRKDPVLCCVSWVNRDTTLNWYWSTGFTNPKPYQGHVCSSESRIASLIRPGIYASVPWVALHKHLQTHPLSSLRLRKARVKEAVNIKWCSIGTLEALLLLRVTWPLFVALESLSVQPWREDLHPWNLSLAHSIFSEISLLSLDPMLSSEGKLGMQKQPHWFSPPTPTPTPTLWREKRKLLVFHPLVS